MTAPREGPDAPPTRADLERLASGVGRRQPVERQRLHELTAEGVERARRFLAGLRASPGTDPEPPRELLYDEPWSERSGHDVEVERRPFATRREAAEYLAPKLDGLRVVDDAGLWSWLGMFYFAGTVPRKNGAVDLPAVESFVFRDDPSTTEGRRSYQRRYRHYLRSAWRLHEQHADAAFLLDEPITAFPDLTDRILSNFRVFNSRGVVPLMLRLYTDGSGHKPLYPRSPGGLRHLIRVLDQLERTYDVYGMEPDALLRVLPSEFRAWDGVRGPQH